MDCGACWHAVPLGTLAVETHAFCRPIFLQTPAHRGIMVTLHLGCTLLHFLMSHWLKSLWLSADRTSRGQGFSLFCFDGTARIFSGPGVKPAKITARHRGSPRRTGCVDAARAGRARAGTTGRHRKVGRLQAPIRAFNSCRPRAASQLLPCAAPLPVPSGRPGPTARALCFPPSPSHDASTDGAARTCATGTESQTHVPCKCQ